MIELSGGIACRKFGVGVGIEEGGGVGRNLHLALREVEPVVGEGEGLDEGWMRVVVEGVEGVVGCSFTVGFHLFLVFPMRAETA